MSIFFHCYTIFIVRIKEIPKSPIRSFCYTIPQSSPPNPSQKKGKENKEKNTLKTCKLICKYKGFGSSSFIMANKSLVPLYTSEYCRQPETFICPATDLYTLPKQTANLVCSHQKNVICTIPDRDLAGLVFCLNYWSQGDG